MGFAWHKNVPIQFGLRKSISAGQIPAQPTRLCELGALSFAIPRVSRELNFAPAETTGTFGRYKDRQKSTTSIPYYKGEVRVLNSHPLNALICGILL